MKVSTNNPKFEVHKMSDVYELEVLFHPYDISPTPTSISYKNQLCYKCDMKSVKHDGHDYLALKFYPPTKYPMSIDFTLHNVTTVKSITKWEIIPVGSRALIWDKIISLKDLANKSNGWLINHNKIVVTLMWRYPIAETYVDPNVHNRNFLSRLLLNCSKDEDLTICSCDGKMFMINRFIFASHSPELEVHLKYQKNGRIQFSDIESNVLEHIISYLKTGFFLRGWGLYSIELAFLADRYNLVDMFHLLEDHLTTISVNHTGLIHIAARFNSMPLFKVLGQRKLILESLFEFEGDNVKLGKDAKNPEVNSALLSYEGLNVFEDDDEEELINMFDGFNLSTVKGALTYLKSSTLPVTADDPMGYRELSEKFCSNERNSSKPMAMSGMPWNQENLEAYLILQDLA